jgi:branched-chain amino acid aminotransferase
MRKAEWIWKDGAFVAWEDATTHVTAHSLHYGVAAFEGIRCYQTDSGSAGIFRLNEHLQRLHESAHIVMMPVPFTVPQLADACTELVRKNQMLDGCYIRPIAYMGEGELGIAAQNPTQVQIIAWRWGSYLGEEGIKNGIRCKISSFRRPAVDSMLAKAKLSGNYVSSILARREANSAGYQEALLLDRQGYVAEGSGENIFVVIDGKVRTPPAGAAILRGVTRDTAITLMREAGVVVEEGFISRDELYCAQEVFLTGTAAEITPVREIDNRRIADGKPGEVTRLVQKAYGEAVRGKNEKHASWLTRVS